MEPCQAQASLGIPKLERAMDDERYDAVLGVKETLRQFRQFVGECGEKTADNLLSGRIPVDQSQVGTGSGEESLAGPVRQTPGRSVSVALNAEHEALAEGQALMVQFLATNAQTRADAGLSKEQWIAEVLSGHADDDDAQIGCLLRIAELWKSGPWPWPRSVTWEEQAANERV
jgi:hypothetical protein